MFKELQEPLPTMFANHDVTYDMHSDGVMLDIHINGRGYMFKIHCNSTSEFVNEVKKEFETFDEDDYIRGIILKHTPIGMNTPIKNLVNEVEYVKSMLGYIASHKGRFDDDS